jgi:NitT/TauT family transport system permease protein
MKKLIGLVTPFRTVTASTKRIGVGAVIISIVLLWMSSGKDLLPTPVEILKAYPVLFDQNDLTRNFMKSIMFCLKCMGYALLISLVVTYLCRLPIFEALAQFLRKFRFLPSAGLSFLFMKLTGNVEGQMLWMMVFGITTWMIYSFVGIAMDISYEDVTYAKSLRLNRWEMLRELLIYGKAAEIFEAAVGIFAIAWMLLAAVENIAKASGGIGVVLAESNKYFKMEKVYAIQILILVTGIFIDWALRAIKVMLFPYSSIKGNS